MVKGMAVFIVIVSVLFRVLIILFFWCKDWNMRKALKASLLKSIMYLMIKLMFSSRLVIRKVV